MRRNEEPKVMKPAPALGGTLTAAAGTTEPLGQGRQRRAVVGHQLTLAALANLHRPLGILEQRTADSDEVEVAAVQHLLQAIK